MNGHLLDLQQQIGDLRTEVHEEIGDLRTDVREEIGKLDTRIARLETLFETHLVGAARSGSPEGKPEPPSGS